VDDGPAPAIPLVIVLTLCLSDDPPRLVPLPHFTSLLAVAVPGSLGALNQGWQPEPREREREPGNDAVIDLSSPGCGRKDTPEPLIRPVTGSGDLDRSTQASLGAADRMTVIPEERAPPRCDRSEGVSSTTPKVLPSRGCSRLGRRRCRVVRMLTPSVCQV
jgi:hypothetical protein